jgi:signal transduction histidine kinase
VVADASRLKQVVDNYLSNAIKFTPNDGRVVLRAGPDRADAFQLEVEDTGSGIPPGGLGRLFVKFRQLDAGAAKQHPGTGLGLALTKQIVEAQGGRVGVASRLGKGSRFFAVLPRAPPPSRAEGHPKVVQG